MVDLLPPNATTLERRLAAVNAGLGDLPTPLRDLVNPDTCPAALLPWLASYLSVDSWNLSWSDDQKRQAIKASLPVHQKKGTAGAVKRALASLGYGAELQEWFAQIPAGAPYTYRLLLEITNTGIDKAGLEALNRVQAAAKNLRSHLDSIRITVKSTARPKVAVAAGIGMDLTVGYRLPRWLLLEGFQNGDAPTEEAVDLLHILLHRTLPTGTYW